MISIILTLPKPEHLPEIAHQRFWHTAYRPDLMVSTFAPSGNASIYLSHLEASGLHLITGGNVGFKFDYVGLGTGWAFTFRCGIYKLMRGTGGSANTLVLVRNFGTISLAPPSSATGTCRNLTVVTSTDGLALTDGIYFIAFQWQDTSSVTVPPSAVTFTSYGATMPSYAGYMYYGDGTNVGSLPATIASLGSAATFQIYYELK